MKLTLKKNYENDIPVKEMKDGDIAIITLWANIKSHPSVGTLVHRYQNILVALGQQSGLSWDGILYSPDRQYGCRVRLLKSGDTILVD